MNTPPGSMPDRGDASVPKVTPEIVAEASLWIARLHGPSRTPAMERECLQWQQRSAAHRLAFERCTDTWQDVARITVGDAYAAAASARWSTSADDAARAQRARWPVPLAAGAMLTLAVVAGHFWLERGVFATGVGEQQMVVLEDGSRLSLNTGTKLRVDMSAEQRSVRLESGEAVFDVAKDARRPFVVRAGGSQVVAKGTVFSVRLDTPRNAAPDALSVTLIEGAITLQPSPAGASGGLVPTKQLQMQPGERVRLTRNAGGPDAAEPHVDRPRLEALLAWKQGQAVFDDIPLADAVAELNRYNRTQIVLVGQTDIGDLRVSGVYRAGDNAGFARDVAALHGLTVRELDGRLELKKPQ